MSGSRAPAEPEVTRFEATVERVDDREVVLDETYFYPEGGGQPADRGTLAGHAVADVREGPDGVVHALDEPPAFGAGDAVAGAVDEAFRTYCRRAHTASHALYGAGRRLLEELGYGGFDIGERKVRVDLTTPTEIDDGTLVELERLTNRVVWESRPVTWETYPREEALAMDRIAFNTKTEEGVADEDVRVVTIGPGVEDDADPWDVAACGGTHVRDTREIGPVTVLERSNPGEGRTRVEFAVGPPGVERRAAEKRAAMEAAGLLGTNVAGLPDDARRLLAEVEEVTAERDALRERLVGARVEELAGETVERGGDEWLVGTVEGPGPNDLGDRAKEAAGDAADVVALVGLDSPPFVVVASASDVGAGDVVEEVTGEFGGGGGGSPSFAQGGGLDADPESVVEFLR